MAYKEICPTDWEYSKDGDFIEGVVVRKQDDVGINKANLYSIETPEGVKNVWGSAINTLELTYEDSFLTDLANFGIIYNESVQIYDWIWVLIKILALVLILGFGVFGLLGHIAELHSAKKLRKKLGLSAEEFKILVEAYQITGM